MKYIISIIILSLLASCKTGKNAVTQDQNSIFKKWELTSIDGKKVKQESPIFLNFKDDNTVNGHIGCNSVNGSFTIKDNSIQFKQLATTRKACMTCRLNKAY